MVIAGITGLSCLAPPRIGQPRNDFVHESFDDSADAARGWMLEPTTISGSRIQFEKQDGNGFVSLALSEHETRELTIRRSIDFSELRGQRALMSVRVRTQSAGGGAARVRFSTPVHGKESHSNTTERTLSSESWTDVHLVLDIHHDTTIGNVVLALKGSGTAWFDDVRITSLGPLPRSTALDLQAGLLERLVTLSRVLSLVRHFHPSDQSAKLDWNTFSVMAMEQVLRARRDESMQRLLTEIFAKVAPTVSFVRHGERVAPALSRDTAASRLVRWFHQGLGPTGVYRSFRDGIDAEEAGFGHFHSAFELPRPEACASAEIQAAVRLRSDTGAAYLVAVMLRSGDQSSYLRETITAKQLRDITIVRGEIPPDTQQIRLGVYLEGAAAIEIGRISLRCQNGDSASVDAGNIWAFSQDTTLFRAETVTCEMGNCLVASRIPAATEIVPARDVVETEIGSGLRIILPVAVWSDGHRTFPTSEAVKLRYDAALPDAPVRLAAIATTWGILAWFYPYLTDQRLNWDGVLSRALSEAAATSTPEGVHEVLSRLVASLRDGHGRVIHPARPNQGILPIAFRKLNDKIVVVGGLPEYLQVAPPGSELLALDAQPVRALYQAAYETVSASTAGWHENQAVRRLAIGQLGAFKRVQLRLSEGSERSLTLPLVSRETFNDSIKERRPKSGSELAPSIFYVDPMKVGNAELPALVLALKRAKVVIIDQRGYIKSGMLQLIAHFISRRMPSPVFSIPIATPVATRRHEDASWLLWPAAPQLTARLVVLTDGRAISAAETVLQILKDNGLATFIGEPTAGTNGNVNDVIVPGGFEVRFTGMRTQFPDGSSFQGRGIVPDQLVRPTLEGIRAGRDEILEAGIAAAQRLAPK